MGRGKRKTFPSQVQNQGVYSRWASNKMKGRRQNLFMLAFGRKTIVTNAWVLLRGPGPTAQNITGPFWQVVFQTSFRTCSGRILSLQFTWRHCNLLNKGPGVLIYPLLKRNRQELEKLTGVKVTCFHQSISSQILHAWTAEQVGTNFNYQQIYISRKTIFLPYVKH